MPDNPLDHPDFPTLLDANYNAIREEEIASVDDIIPTMFNTINSTRPYELFGELGEMGSWPEFQGSDVIQYDLIVEEYNSRGDPREYATGLKFTRRMIADDLTGILRGDRYRQMVRSGTYTRQEHATRFFENVFINDTHYFTRSEGLPVASTAHTTRHPGVSTATGFSNMLTSALSQGAIRAAMIMGRKIASNRGKRSNMTFDELYVPIDLVPLAQEILQTETTPGVATPGNLTINPEYRALKIVVIPLWSSSVNWGIGNSRLRKENLYWIERESPEYGKMEDFDSFQMKFRGYQRHGMLVRGWRWAIWSRVG